MKKKTSVKKPVKKIPKEYNFKAVEKKWTAYWLKKKVYEPDIAKTKKPFYNLMMFPYPSAEGLHVGNMYAFTGSDIFGRFTRMQGNDVLEPIGLDGFGIHSENYAMKKGVHPMRQAKVAEKNFYKQLHMIGNGFAWDHHLETYDPEYYKWTQWLFTQMFNAGLAYRKKAPVNWCPSCKTVLADEQVIAGRCERCDSEVSKKELEQWFFRITKYAPKLLKNLDKIDWSDKVKIAQRNWIGKSEGVLIPFEVDGPSLSVPVQTEVFTTRPDTIMGVTFVVVAPESEIIEKLKSAITNWKEVEEYVWKSKNKPEAERMAEDKEKTGVELKGIKAINPANGMEVPVWVADYVLAGYGTGVVMGVPAYDARDLAFAQAFGLRVVQSPLVPRENIIKRIKGKTAVKYRLRDWLISRQRYWGPPIPLIYCRHCAEKINKAKGKERQKYSLGELQNPGWFAVNEKNLPVVLPFVKEFRPTGTGDSPLSAVPSFYKTKCSNCGRDAKRETDVSDTFLDSSWYFLRYPSFNNRRNAFDKKTTKKWLPVDMYLGGAEHSVLHLLYSRFVTMALKDMGHIDFDEPFSKFRAHGLIIRDGTKMSKSKGNVVNPDDYIKRFGADALRMHLMFLGPLEDGGDFRDAGMVGVTRFLGRLWSFSTGRIFKGKELSLWMNGTIKKITEDIPALKYNTAIAELMIALNNFT
ncbi:MAG: class I tRNA ligase family protein, partial [Candidatus Colwellbacteria bacterium]|nr:class I tRNA ligase family protein [Candidatus Colwellbacteria bacterium]